MNSFFRHFKSRIFSAFPPSSSWHNNKAWRRRSPPRPEARAFRRRAPLCRSPPPPDRWSRACSGTASVAQHPPGGSSTPQCPRAPSTPRTVGGRRSHSPTTIGALPNSSNSPTTTIINSLSGLGPSRRLLPPSLQLCHFLANSPPPCHRLRRNWPKCRPSRRPSSPLKARLSTPRGPPPPAPIRQ